MKGLKTLFIQTNLLSLDDRQKVSEKGHVKEHIHVHVRSPYRTEATEIDTRGFYGNVLCLLT